ncbi:MAG TPA: TonB-dependent receptor [Burkholderiaceae bacterium]|nr:TonB-dependent receptor [Burkholderiaceae bacterium]
MHLPFFHRTLISAAIGAALHIPAHAADEVTLPIITVTEQETSAATLNPSASVERQRLARIPGGTNLIEPQLQGRLLTLGDALNYQPGLIVQEFFGGTDQPRLNIRGSGIQSNPVNRGVLLLQDGLPLNEADGSFIIGVLEPRNAGLISVRRGANAITPAATTLGGEVDFQSLTGVNDTGGVRLEGGSFGRRNLQAAIGGQRGNLDGHISVSHDEGDGFRHHSESKRTSFQANAGIWDSNGFENRAYLSWTDLNFKIPSVVSKSLAESDPQAVTGDGNTPRDALLNTYKRDPRREATQLRLANRTRWGSDDLNQELGIYAQQTNDLFVDPLSQTDTRSNTYGAQWQLSGKADRLDYRLAASWANSDMDRQLFANNPQTGQKMQRFGNFDLQADNQDLLGGLEWHLAPQFSLVGETKLSHVSRDAANRDTGAALDQSWSYATPKVGVNWNLAPGQRWYANLNRSNEAPSFWEIVTGSVNPVNPAVASSSLTSLKLQRAITAEIGGQGDFTVSGNPGTWSVSVYRSVVDDELISTTDANGVKVGTYNYVGGTIHQGIEAGVNGTLPSFGGTKLDYRLAWTYSDFRFRGGEFAGNQIAGVPRNLINVELLQRSGAWRFGPNVIWLPQATPTDHANVLYQESYALLGWKIDYHPDKNWSAYLQFDNLTDRHYTSSYAIRNRSALTDNVFLPGNGRSVLAGLSYHF